MVTVQVRSTDPITAWRIRDVLACHPLLAGPRVDIQISADHDEVVLRGWVADARLIPMAGRLARTSAGSRSVHLELQHQARCRGTAATSQARAAGAR